MLAGQKMGTKRKVSGESSAGGYALLSSAAAELAAWRGMARRGTTFSDIAQCSMAQRFLAWHSISWHGTVLGLAPGPAAVGFPPGLRLDAPSCCCCRGATVRSAPTLVLV